MIIYLVGSLELERLAGVGAGYAQLLDDRFLLPPRKNSKSITSSKLAPAMLD
jgi:hypothetical protein